MSIEIRVLHFIFIINTQLNMFKKKKKIKCHKKEGKCEVFELSCPKDLERNSLKKVVKPWSPLENLILVSFDFISPVQS